MNNTEEIFIAAQFVIMKGIRNLSDVHGNFQDIDLFSVRSNLSFLENNIKTLRKLCNAMEDMEYGDVIKEIFDDTIDEAYDDDDETSSELDEQNQYDNSESTVTSSSISVE